MNYEIIDITARELDRFKAQSEILDYYRASLRACIIKLKDPYYHAGKSPEELIDRVLGIIDGKA